MRRICLLAMFLALPAWAVAAPPYSPVVNHSRSSNRVDLVIVGDGYTVADLASGLYERDAANAVAAIFAQQPYAEYEPYFNVWRIDVQSSESGADHPGAGVFRSTAFDAAFECGGIATSVCVSPQKVSNVISSTGLASDMVLVLVNDPANGYTRMPTGGTPLLGQTLDVASTNAAVTASLLHEDPETVVRIYSRVSPFDLRDDGVFYIRAGQRSRIPAVSLVRPATHSLILLYTVDGIVVASDGSTLDTTGPAPGSHTLQAEAYDPTPFVADGPLRLPPARWTLTVAPIPEWTVTPVDLNGDGRSDLAVFDRRLGRFLLEDGSTFAWGHPGDIPLAADFNGDRRKDLAVFRPSTATWYVPGRAPVHLGAPGDMPIPMDNWNDASARAQPMVFHAGEDNDSVGTVLRLDVAGGEGAGGFRGSIIGTPYTHKDVEFNGGPFPALSSWQPWQARFSYGSLEPFGRPGDIPVPGNFVGDLLIDQAVFRPSTGVWYIRDGRTGSSAVQYLWGAAGDMPVLLDRDGDGQLELGVFRPSTAYFYFLNLATNAIESVHLGNPGDVPLGATTAWWLAHNSGDADGDRRADLSVFRPSTNEWWFSLSSGTLGVPSCPPSICTFDFPFPKTAHVTWGVVDDIPARGDYDGDGRMDPTVFRPSDGTWNILRSAGNFTDSVSIPWGLAGDIPVQADYDADDRLDVAVFRPSTGRWFVRTSVDQSVIAIDWGQAGDIPVPADYDGDGRADLAVFRPAAGQWFILNRFDGTYEVRDWGVAGDIPAAADYDADGLVDEAVFRPSEGRWYVRLSSTHATLMQDWGVSGDTPQPADYDGDGKANFAVFRPSTGRWYVLNLFTRDWGLPGDVPVVRQP